MPTFTNNFGGRLEKEGLETRGAWRLLIFMAFVFLVFLVAYFGLIFGYQNYVEAQIAKFESELTDLAAQVPEVEQEEFIKFEFQLINLKKLLDNHVAASKILPLIEGATGAKVYYTKMGVNVREGRVNLAAVADSYETLASQLEAFSRMTEVSRFQMSNASTGADGKVQFDILLFLKPEVFKS